MHFVLTPWTLWQRQSLIIITTKWNDRSSCHDKSWPNNCDSKSKSLFYQIQTTKQHVAHKQQHVHSDCMNAEAHMVRFSSALKMALTDGDKLHGVFMLRERHGKKLMCTMKKCASQTWSWTCSAIFFEVLMKCLNFIMFSTNVQIKKQVISWLFQSPNTQREREAETELTHAKANVWCYHILCHCLPHQLFFFFLQTWVTCFFCVHADGGHTSG